MKYFLIPLLIFLGCSETPNEPPVDSYRNVEFNIDMNQTIDNNFFEADIDTLTLILDSTDEFQLTDENNDNIFICIISDLIFGQSYQYQYAINGNLEGIDDERSFTVNDEDNLISDYYGELNPTILIFFVNMSHQIELENFNPDTQFLDVAGTFNSWDGAEHHLDETDEDIYTITITNVVAGDEVEFKFRIDGDWENSEFPGYGENRSYTVEQGENILELWYDDNEGN